MLPEIHNAPHPACGLGQISNPGSFLAPAIRYAFNLSAYRYGSFPSIIPHCIRQLAAPVTNGVAIDVPVFAVYPPLGAADIISTPGATISGLTIPLVVYPLPENGAIESVAESYAPTDITLPAVEGIVRVVSAAGLRNKVSVYIELPAGSHI